MYNDIKWAKLHFYVLMFFNRDWVLRIWLFPFKQGKDTPEKWKDFLHKAHSMNPFSWPQDAATTLLDWNSKPTKEGRSILTSWVKSSTAPVSGCVLPLIHSNTQIQSSCQGSVANDGPGSLSPVSLRTHLLFDWIAAVFKRGKILHGTIKWYDFILKSGKIFGNLYMESVYFNPCLSWHI